MTLVIFEPNPGGGLRQEIRDFYEQATWKNRVAFLGGATNTYSALIETGKRLKAIQHIINELKISNIPENDPQMVNSRDLADKITANFRSAVRETFTTLWYPPISDQGTPALVSADFSMRFEGNNYSGEKQIIELLKDKQKFTEDVSGETFRKKCEQRLFTIQSMPWNEIKKRAGMLTKWQWHLPAALDDLKAVCLQKDIWRENGGYIDKGPFPQPKTRAEVQEKLRDSDTGEATLKVVAVNGDTVYYDFGANATTASAKLEGAELKTTELAVSFLVVDSTHVHETGDPVTWKNRITIKYRFFQENSYRKLELQAAPEAPAWYTTDGSDPKVAGAAYDGPFAVPTDSPFVLVYAEREGVGSEVQKIAVPKGTSGGAPVMVDPKTPAVWMRALDMQSTKETYEAIDRAKKFKASFVGIRITISGDSGNHDWLELNTFQEKVVTPELVEECLDMLRKLQGNGQVQLAAEALSFNLGQDLLDWVTDVKTALKPGEVKQK